MPCHQGPQGEETRSVRRQKGQRESIYTSSFYYRAGSCQVEIAPIWHEEKHRCQELWLEMICYIIFKHPQNPEGKRDVNFGSQFGPMINGSQILNDRNYESPLEHQCSLLKDYPFFTEFLLHLCQNPTDHTCVDLFFGLCIMFHGLST